MTLDAVCRRYGQRPSGVVGIADPRVAYDFDAAIMYRAAQHAAHPERDPSRYDEDGNCIDFTPIVRES